MASISPPGKGGGRPIERRFLVCHWNDRALGVAVQLTAPVLLDSERVHLNVLAEPAELAAHPVPGPLSRRFSGLVQFVHGEPESREDLLAAGLAQVESVVIISPDGDPGEADARTLLTLALLVRLTPDLPGPPPRVVLELRSRRHLAKAETLRRLSLRHGLAVEMLQTWEIQTRVFSQAARSPGLSYVYLNLLTFSKDTAEPYRLALPEPGGDWRLSFFVFYRLALELQGRNQSAVSSNSEPGLVLPVGILRPEGSVASPLRAGADTTVRAGDELLCFARSLEAVRALGDALSASWDEIVPDRAHPEVELDATGTLQETGPADARPETSRPKQEGRDS